MKKITREEIEGYEKLYRVNLINSIKGFGAANLIGSKDEAGKSNVAIFSSVTHLGSSPALFGFIVRPVGWKDIPFPTYKQQDILQSIMSIMRLLSSRTIHRREWIRMFRSSISVD